MESTPSKLETVVRPISALRELVSFVKPATKIRPIANLIIKRPDWFIAEPKTSFVANETFSKSYLGAFLGVSVFDDRRLSSNFYHFPILFTNFWYLFFRSFSSIRTFPSLLSGFESIQQLNAEARTHIATTLRRRLDGPRAEMFLVVEAFLKECWTR